MPAPSTGPVVAGRVMAEPQQREIGGEMFSCVGLYDLDPDYRRDPRTQHFCSLCQKDIKHAPDETAYLHFVDGGMWILSVADEARYEAMSAKQPGRQDAGELGFHPVGNDCARKLPKGFVHPPKRIRPALAESRP